MTVKLYGVPYSTCTRRVATFLNEKNVPYELIQVDLTKGEHKLPEFLKLQPFGQIPALVDGDVHVFESRAICHYIEAKYSAGGPVLIPFDDAAKLAAVEQWLNVEVSHYNPPVSEIVAELVWKTMNPDYKPDLEHVAALKKKLEHALDIYEAHLAHNEYLAGAEFSFADLSHLPYGDYLVHAGHGDVFESRPHVKRWWHTIHSRPSFQKAIRPQTSAGVRSAIEKAKAVDSASRPTTPAKPVASSGSRPTTPAKAVAATVPGGSRPTSSAGKPSSRPTTPAKTASGAVPASNSRPSSRTGAAK